MAQETENTAPLATPVDPSILESVAPRPRRRRASAKATKTTVNTSSSVSLEKKPAAPSVPVIPMAPGAPPAVSIATTKVEKTKTVLKKKVKPADVKKTSVASPEQKTAPSAPKTVNAQPQTATAPKEAVVLGTPVVKQNLAALRELANLSKPESLPSVKPVVPLAVAKDPHHIPVPVQTSVTPLNQSFSKQVGFRGNRRGGQPLNPNQIAGGGKETRQVSGFLDCFRENLPVIRVRYGESEEDAFVPPQLMRKYRLQPGDVVAGVAREPKDTDRYWGMMTINTINDIPAEEYISKPRVRFHQLTPVYPDEQLKLETGAEPISTRMVDLIAPIGKGQRSLIVSPPKAGKTSLLKEISTGVAANYPDIFLMAVLIGERPEEVTDLRRHIEKITHGRGEVAASNFDEPAESQCRIAELALERAKRLVEKGMDVVILLDSITRLARAYNLSIPTSGRTLSGGFDPAALFPPKRFFGAARNFEVPGSLTIIGTALVDTGSRMDDLVYEEFKGTGNQELHLDRRLAERRIYPAIEVQKSGTRRDDLLMDPVTYQSVLTLQRMLDTLDNNDRTVTLMNQMRRTKTNREFLQSLRNG